MSSLPDDKPIVLTQAAWVQRARELFGDDQLTWRFICPVDPAGWWIKIEDSFGSLSRADEERLRSIARRAMEIAIKAKPRSYRRRAR